MSRRSADRSPHGALGAVQRSIFGAELTEREKIDKALQSKDVSDVKDIDDFAPATSAERIDLVYILLNQGWVGPRDEWALERIWKSFGDQLPDVARLNIVAWDQSVQRGAELTQLMSVKRIQSRFLTDVQNLTLSHIRKNREHILKERESLGLGSTATPPTPEQNQRLRATQEVAKAVADAQNAEKNLCSINVGDEYVIPDDGIPYWAPLSFDPQRRPDRNRAEATGVGKDSDWAEVNRRYEPVAALIRQKANSNVAVYAAIQSEDNQGHEVLTGLGRETDPLKARAALGRVTLDILDRMRIAEGKISANDPDYRDLLPVHSQLFSGTRVEGGLDWNDSFNRWVAQRDLADHKAEQFWIRLGLQTLAAAAFVVAEVATAGSATFFIAAGVGLLSAGEMAVDSYEKYSSLANAAKTNVKDDTAIVSPASVSQAERQAIDDALAFAVAAASLGARALSGPGKTATPGPEACFAAATQIVVPNGYLPIESLSVGSQVTTRDMAGRLGEARVTRTFHSTVPEFMTIRSASTVITCTAAHPFWVNGDGWLSAGLLRVGLNLWGKDGPVIVEDIQRHKVPIHVYNVEVDPTHTYLVSDLGVLVHNKAAPAMRYKLQPHDEDWRGSGRTTQEAINHAFEKTGVDRRDFKVTHWGVTEHGKSFPAEYRVDTGPNRGAEVNVDLAHERAGPDVPHVGWQTPGKRGSGGGARGHILLDDVQFNR